MALWASSASSAIRLSIYGIEYLEQDERTPGLRAGTGCLTPRSSVDDDNAEKKWAAKPPFCLCNPRQNSMRAATDGGVSIEPKLATCSWRTLPFSRRVSTKLIASP
jgi:hypothetical protein